MSFKEKYLKYKMKYLKLKKQKGSGLVKSGDPLPHESQFEDHYHFLDYHGNIISSDL